jgi:hypothetical protein
LRVCLVGWLFGCLAVWLFGCNEPCPSFHHIYKIRTNFGLLFDGSMK